jgi:hypothetical protein
MEQSPEFTFSTSELVRTDRTGRAAQIVLVRAEQVFLGLQPAMVLVTSPAPTDIRCTGEADLVWPPAHKADGWAAVRQAPQSISVRQHRLWCPGTCCS